eukprot:jgi/Mesvir1/22736/Mv14139-RA.1
MTNKMRASHSKTGEDLSMRNAELLFETRSIAEIREIEARTTREVDEKKEELRQLVGASYRDLIESADTIIEMKRSSEAVVENVKRMQDGFASLRSLVETSVHKGGPADKERETRQQLFAVGCRVKYLVDTPEMIWGCLDEHLYLEAAERYLRAWEVHSLLAAAPAKQEARARKKLLAGFTLLRHQWPLVKTFRGQITQRSHERLKETDLTATQYAVALAACALIDGLTSAEVLHLFLDVRKEWLLGQLRAAVARASANISGGSLSRHLCHMVHVLQLSLAAVGEMFLELPPGTRPLVVRTALAPFTGDGLWGGIPDPAEEHATWDVRHSKATENLAGMSSEAVAATCRKFLETCAQCVAAEGKFLLATVDSTSHLAELEQEIRSAFVVTPAGQGAGAPWPPHAVSWLEASYGSKVDDPWGVVCQQLLRRDVPVWETFFSGMFVQRAKDLLDAAFASIDLRDRISTQLEAAGGADASSEAATEAAAGRPGEPLGFPRAPLKLEAALKSATELRMADPFQLASGESLGEQGWRIRADEKRLDWVAARERYHSPAAAQLRSQMDAQLAAILRDTLCVLGAGEATAGGGSHLGGSRHGAGDEPVGVGVGGSKGSSAGLLRRGSGVVASSSELERFLQERCVSALSGIISHLDDHLARLKAGTATTTATTTSATAGSERSVSNNAEDLSAGPTCVSAHTVERALFLGRVASILRDHSAIVPVILGDPQRWREWQAQGGPGAEAPSQGEGGDKGVYVERGIRTMWSQSWAPGGQARSMYGEGRRGVGGRDYIKRGGKGGSAPSGLGAEEAVAPSPLDTLRTQLFKVSFEAHRLWVDWAAAGLADRFRQLLWAEESLATSVPLKGWEEIIVKHEDEAGGAGVSAGTATSSDPPAASSSSEDMKVSLPCMPSGALLGALLGAVTEMHRAGSHTVDTAVLRLLAWTLGEKLLSVYEQLADICCGDDGPTMPAGNKAAAIGAPKQPTVSEKGVLQLLFDVRFAMDILAGGENVVEPTSAASDEDGASGPVPRATTSSASSAAAEAARDRKARVATLLQRLSGQLDPIDWATYEPYLWAGAQRYYQRVAVLFGSLAQLRRLYTEQLFRVPFSADTNVLNVAAHVPRFSYLPISAPPHSGGLGLARSGSGSAHGKLGGGVSGGVLAAAGLLVPADLASGRGSGEERSSDASAATSEGGTFGSGIAGTGLKNLMGQWGQMGTRFGESLKLGNVLLGDTQSKFKDRSAAAMASFGDILPSTSYFSSLTQGASAAKTDIWSNHVYQ